MGNKVWDMINPRIWHSSYLTHKAIKQNILTFVWFIKREYKLLDLWCWQKPYKSLFPIEMNYIWIDAIDTWYQDYICNARELPFSDNEFDVLISTQALEHIKNTQKTLLEIKRVVKRNWYLFISLPFLYPQHSAPYDFYRFTKNWLYELFKDFEIILIRQNTFYFSTLFLFINLFFVPFPKSRYIFAPIFFINNFFWLILDYIFKHIFSISSKFKDIHDNFVSNYTTDYCLILKNKK